MSTPMISAHFKQRMPSDIRLAQIKFEERQVKPVAINVAIGNVSLPTHPAMQQRMFALNAPQSPFATGVVKYSSTVGFTETNQAFLNIIASGGFATDKLCSQITDGGSHAMEMLLLGVCGAAGTEEKPLLMIDAAYTNYIAFAERIGRKTVSVTRHLGDDGKFSLPQLDKIEATIKEHNPGALLVIPYDNPTGQLYDYQTLVELAKLCVKYNMWMISDEAYRELYYVDTALVSIWGINDKEVPGIEGRRISIETASKVWNACGLRIGALVTDNAEFHKQSVAEYTANLCANVIGQYIFGALAHESKENIAKWCKKQREYYQAILFKVYHSLQELEPRLIVSSPDAAIYSVIDVRNIVKPGFDSVDFVMYCAQEGYVNYQGVDTTLLVAPMKGFYDVKPGQHNPGTTQMRIAYVETPENMDKVPTLFIELLRQYEAKR
ncbi:MAG: aminotransferase class I/II-fold pyridoxal phosphate-dependent enzyme [Clostridia bacterium]